MKNFNKFVCILAVCMLAVVTFTGCSNDNADTCTVTFLTDGGSEVAPVTVTKGSTVAQPAAPTKTNYTFAGWFYQNSDTSFNFSTPITSDTTLVARWTQTATAIVSRPHMDVQGCQQGIKITLKTGVRDAGIHVFHGEHELPVMLETNNEENVYYFPFTESGKQYTVKLDGMNTATDEWFGG